VPGLLKGRRVVILDDSIVRGTTLREIVGMVRSAGASRVDVRIGCPPIRAPCYFGIDMKERKELVAANRTQEEVAQVVGADSVHYLSIPGLVEALGIKAENLCLGCLTGRYPVEVPQERHRYQKSLAEF
jgi:amidophosphoribosyltransferase